MNDTSTNPSHDTAQSEALRVVPWLQWMIKWGADAPTQIDYTHLTEELSDEDLNSALTRIGQLASQIQTELHDRKAKAQRPNPHYALILDLLRQETTPFEIRKGGGMVRYIAHRTALDAETVFEILTKLKDQGYIEYAYSSGPYEQYRVSSRKVGPELSAQTVTDSEEELKQIRVLLNLLDILDRSLGAFQISTQCATVHWLSEQTGMDTWIVYKRLTKLYHAGHIMRTDPTAPGPEQFTLNPASGWRTL